VLFKARLLVQNSVSVGESHLRFPSLENDMEVPFCESHTGIPFHGSNIGILSSECNV
jgi:hypothetical protein